MVPSASVMMMRVRKCDIIQDLPGHDPLSYDHKCQAYRNQIRSPKKEIVEELVEESGT